MTCVTGICVLAASVFGGVGEGASPFASLSFEAACGKARSQGKLVLVYLSEPDNKQCVSYLKFTWSDQDVCGWMDEHVVAIELSAKEHPDFVGRCSARVIPAVVVLTPSGAVRTHVSGFCSPATLLEKLGEALAEPVDPVEQARNRLAQSGDNDKAARFAYAKALHQAKKYPKALVQFEMCLDSGGGSVEEAHGLRMLVIEGLGRLVADHPPTKAVLVKRRDGVRGRIESHSANKSDPVLFAAFNTALGQVDDTLALYRKLHEDTPRDPITLLLRDSTVDSLVKARRHAEALELIDALKHFRFALDQHRADEKRPVPGGGDAHRFRAFLRRDFIRRSAIYYEILFGADRQEQASEVAAGMLGVDKSSATYLALASAGLRTGRPTKVTLDQASKAVEAASEPDVEMLTVLVRVLQHLDRPQDASRVVKEHAPKIGSAQDRKTLEDLVRSSGKE